MHANNPSALLGYVTECHRHGFIYDSYTSLWNVLDYCAATVPVTQVCPEKDKATNFESRNAVEDKVWKYCTLSQHVQCGYSS
jgi:hypothetical protein